MKRGKDGERWKLGRWRGEIAMWMKEGVWMEREEKHEDRDNVEVIKVD